ncbi:predicted protein [Nematostella vectensis]|uniref:Iodothyronine deiodinase n=1 Tax=Nematostella vectensis TaxID=45351 RepID=A7SHT4_NEMVE|nr:predicted protein [Nematostella vectensis]|eukprot:XP_001628745.1 predicted protein [Nematostella vectensis]
MYWKLLFGKEMLENVWRSILVDMNKKVKLDNKAFNSPLVSLSDEGFCRLLDFAKGDRPLVVNFGSSTCPIFMKKMLEYEKMIVQFKDVADFVIVYIEEAHPSDGWAFDENNNIPTHSSQTERCVAARQLSSQNAICPVLVDSMLNAANVAYGALPIRLYIIRNNHVVYQGGAGPMGYCMDDVINWLSAYTCQKH